MPKMMTIEPNPMWATGTADQKKAFAAAAALPGGGKLTLPYVSAMENIRLSVGLYVPIMPDEVEVVAAPRTLEDMTMEELKVMLVNLGIKTEKQMKKADVVALIRSKLDAIEVTDEE